MNATLEIRSTHGTLTVDAHTGRVVDASQYDEIVPARFDVAELMGRYGSYYGQRHCTFDILDVGSWDQAGDYIPPCAEWQRDTKDNILCDLSAALGFEVCPDEIPDRVFWQSSDEELRQWACEHLTRNFTVTITEGYGIRVPIGRIFDLRQKADDHELTEQDLMPFNAGRCHREVVLWEEGGQL